MKKKKKDKLPFAVFICPKSNTGDTQDYKQVFTDIISDRIKEKNNELKLFEDKKIRAKWDDEQEKWYFKDIQKNG